jgi:GNAT superfamily N-acetyltransferase
MPWRVLVRFDGQLVAHAGVGERTVSVGSGQVRVGSLGGLFTAPGWEGRGHGSLATETALAFIREELGCLFGFLTCLDHMVPFYLRRGWQRVSAQVAFQQPSGTRHQLVPGYHAMVYLLAGVPWPDGPVNLNGALL